MGTLTRRSLLVAGAAAAAGMALPATPARAGNGNRVLVGQNGNLNIVTPGGAMLMYYHNAWQSGGTTWLGPYSRGSGFNSFGFLEACGVNYSYDNMYVGRNSSGVYGYYWDNQAGRYLNGGAGYPLVNASRRGWDDLINVISGGYNRYYEPGCVFYTIDFYGNLYWHKYCGKPGQGGYWSLNSGRIIGVGWDGFVFVTAGPDGWIYAVDSAGNMRWYLYLTPEDGSSSSWNSLSGTIIGSGWYGGTYGYQTVQAAGFDPGRSDGYGGLYMVDRNGNLRWNRFLGFDRNVPQWLYATGGGKTIGAGWM